MLSKLGVNRTSTLGLSGRSLRMAITITSVIGFSLFGYDQGLMSGLITGKEFNSEFPATGGDDRRTKLVQGAVTACYEIGCFFGSLFVMFRGEQIGRKPLVIMGAFLTIIGTVISTAAFGPQWGLGQFVVGRVCTGVGTGLNTSTIPVWQSEMSKPENRGILVNLEGSMIAVGTMIAYWIDFGLSYVNSSVQWRFPVAMQIFFALLLLAGIWELPDSPRWLMSRGRRDDALHVLAKLDGLPEDDDAIVAEATVIQDAVNRFRHEKRSVKDLFTGGKTQNLQRALVASSTQFFQQFTGCNAAIYYSTVLFQESIGLKGKLPLILGGVFATIYAFFTIPSFFLVETLGRRKLFMLGAAGQAISFTITFGCLTKDDNEVAKGAAVGLFLFICFFGMSMLSLPWIYPPEIASMRVRSATNALSTCTNWLCNFAVVMFTPIFIMDTGYGCYLFFAAMNYLYLPVIFFFYPETAGRSLEEIDIIFAKAHVDGTMPWRVAASLPKLSFSEIEDQANALGLYEDDNEKQDLEFDEAADREEAIKQNSGVQGYTLFEKRENGAESGQPDGSSTSQKSD